MKRINILFISALVITVLGCDGILDVQEKGKVIPQTVSDYDEMLNDHNKFSLSSVNAFYLSDEIKIYADEVSRIPWGSELYVNGFLWKDHIYDDPNRNDRDWNNFYSQIYIYNTVLANIDEAEGEDDILRKETKGEALAQRAYAYFMLVNLYGKHYDESTYETDLGVPLHTAPDINAQKTRASVKEIYELIEGDLLQAAELLPEETDYSYHPSKAGAYGLLAKMYLFMGKWEEAKNYADMALQKNSFLYDYKNFDFIPDAPIYAGLGGYPRQGINNKEYIWEKKAADPFVYNVAVYMSDEHKELYDQGDRRLYFRQIDSFVFGPNAHGPVLFTKEFYYTDGITTPELYLIRAESNARLGRVSDAIADLNTLREHRFNAGEFTPYTTDKTELEALELVLKGRRLELFYHPVRLFDLKRLNKDPRFAKTITHTFDGDTYTIEPGDHNYVIAIPKKVIALNPEIEQNPRDNRN